MWEEEYEQYINGEERIAAAESGLETAVKKYFKILNPEVASNEGSDAHFEHCGYPAISFFVEQLDSEFDDGIYNEETNQYTNEGTTKAIELFGERNCEIEQFVVGYGVGAERDIISVLIDVSSLLGGASALVAIGAKFNAFRDWLKLKGANPDVNKDGALLLCLEMLQTELGTDFSAELEGMNIRESTMPGVFYTVEIHNTKQNVVHIFFVTKGGEIVSRHVMPVPVAPDTDSGSVDINDD